MAFGEHEVSLINGGLVKSHAGRTVQIFLNVEEASSGGHLLQGTTSDKKTITVRFESPLNQPVSGWIEVIGTSDGTGINCSEIIMPPNDDKEAFDAAAHNQVIMFLHNIRDFDIGGDDDNMEY